MIRQGRYTKKVSWWTRAKRYSKRRWRWFKKLSKKKKALVIGTPILAFLIITPIATYLYYANDISNQDRLMNRNNTGIVITDRNGEVIYSTGRAQHRALYPLASIPKITQEALIASEDKTFYQDSGFSVTGILRALYDDATTGSIAGGGSTLTQQLAKNTLLSANQNFFRKYQELAVSIAIEQQYTKDQILDMYFNSSFFGENSFGIEDAAKAYFNETPDQLDLAQSAMLIGVLPAPSAYSPISGNATYAKQRQTTVLTRMVTNGYITDAQKQAALAEVLTYATSQSVNTNDAPNFSQMVLQQLYDKFGEETVLRSGYQVTTTLDMNLQRTLQANITNHIAYINRNGGSNASGVAIDPTSGEVRALVGSADYNNADWGKVNMATTARQPGSSFKPIYYSQALANGTITPASIFADVATDFDGYKPLDASRTFSGNVTVRQALSRSLNIPSVDVLQKFGIDNAVTDAKQMGITTLTHPPYGLSLALGSAEVPLIQMTSAYTAFANQGQQYNTTIIKQVNDKYNVTILKADEKSKEVVSPAGAFLISSILSDNNARAPIFGSSLTISGRTAAVKTGTTDSDRDAWTIGYTPQLVVGVWVGNNNNDVMLNGGSGMAGPIWLSTMSQALKGIPNTPFPIPSSVVQKPVCYGSGSLANASGTGTYNEYFLASALPSTTCSPQQPVQQPIQDTTKNQDTSSSTSNPSTGSSSTSGSASDGTTTTPTTGGTGTSGTGTGTGSTGTGSTGTTTPGTGGTTVPVTP
jgi:1A family penicillin-binding protein